MTTDERMIELLEQILAQLDYLNKTIDNCESQIMSIARDTERIGEN